MSDDLGARLVGKTWLAVREAAPKAGGRVYRSSPSGAGGMAAPPLGRGGSETIHFDPQGRFSIVLAGPDDRPRTHTGQWKAVGDDTVELAFDQAGLKGTAKLQEGGTLSLDLSSAK